MRTALLLLIFQLGHASRWTDQSNKPPPEPHPADTTDSFVMSECLNEKYTRLSCAKVFCPPWRRCIAGQCVCKLPYQCLQTDKRVCGMDGKPYLSLCQVQALACKTKQPMFSHFDKDCKEDHVFKVQLKQFDGKEVVQVKSKEVEALVCATDYWDMAAANVVCRQKKDDARGAIATGRIGVSSISARLQLPAHCMSVRCTGSEFSLAECTLYQPQWVTPNTTVTWVKCHKQGSGPENISGFSCVNKKVIPLKHTCDGVDHCGDYSDEMCCKSCRRKAFRCRSGVCIPRYAVNDQIRDCLGGEDEVENQIPRTEHPTETAREEPEVEKDSRPDVTPHSALVKHEEHEHEEHKKDPVPHVEETPWSNPTDDIRETRRIAENQLQCGIPNMDYVYKTEDQTRRTRRTRQKRVVGGAEALPTQIQWQVAVQEDGKIHCGGVFLGGCWVLTAAHCVRQKPQSFRIKFSLWKKSSLINTTDNIPVKKIIVHERYDPQTYLNDIALVQLEELAFEKVCVSPNPAVRSVCVPWSIMQFQPGDTCTISGWGRNKEGDSSNALKWANVTLIGECKKYYKERFHEGMECAGDVEGKVDSCQGDSGGPLVCKDESGLSYVWGIVSWGEKCGEPGFPGVYTKVAHYFEWIRSVTGWPAVTKYNH